MIKLVSLIVFIIIKNTERIIETISKFFTIILLFAFTSSTAQIDNNTFDENLTKIQSQTDLPGFALTIINKNSTCKN
jgi:hypothetical protein